MNNIGTYFKKSLSQAHYEPTWNFYDGIYRASKSRGDTTAHQSLRTSTLLT